MVCQKSRPDVTERAPNEIPYRPVAMLMEIPTLTAGDAGSFTAAAGRGCPAGSRPRK